MSENELKEIGIKVSERRSYLRELALAAAQKEDILANQKAVEQLSKRMTRGYFQAAKPTAQLHAALKAQVPALCQHRGTKRGNMSFDEQMEVARKALIACEAYKDVAKAHRISVSRVSAIVKKVR